MNTIWPNQAMEPTPPDLFMSLLVVQPSFCSHRGFGGVADLGFVRPVRRF
jgi:hypothetical protein